MPALTVHDGQAEHVTGAQIMDRIAATLRDALPLVPLDDPHRAALVGLAYAVGAPEATTTLRPVS